MSIEYVILYWLYESFIKYRVLGSVFGPVYNYRLFKLHWYLPDH